MILFFAVMRILNSPISSVLMAIASLGLFVFQTGIEINFKENLYRNVSIFDPQYFGNWEPLPELEYVSLFKTNLVHTVTGRSGVSVSEKSSIVQVSLVAAGNKKIKVFEGKDMTEAIEKAKDFSDKLKINIWDATIRPADWYSEKKLLVTTNCFVVKDIEKYYPQNIHSKNNDEYRIEKHSL